MNPNIDVKKKTSQYPNYLPNHTNTNHQLLPPVPISGSRAHPSRSEYPTTRPTLHPNPRFRNPERGGRGGDRITCSRRRRTGTAGAPGDAACGGTSGPCAPSARTRTRRSRPPSGGCCGGGGDGGGRSPRWRRTSPRRIPCCRCRTRRTRPGTAPWLPAAAAAARGARALMRRGETGSSGSICPNSTHEARALRCSLAGLAASGPGRVLLSA